MTRTPEASVDTALARGTIYQCLAQACAYPGEAFAEALTRGVWLASLQEALDVIEAAEGCRDALETLEIVQPSIDLSALGREYIRLFSNTALTDFPPYGADYLASHIFMKAQSLADVAGFYRAFGVGVGAGTERPDHISAELEFMGYLCFKEAYAADRGLPEAWEVTTAAQRRFLTEHLGRWAPLFFKRFATASVQPLYRAATTFAQAFLDDEATRLGVSPEPIVALPPDAPVAADATCGVDEGQCPLAEEGWASGTKPKER